MAKEIIKVQVSYIYEIEIDTKSSYVKDYDSRDGLIENLVDDQFQNLEVIGKGVEIKNVEVDFYEIV